MTEFDRFAALSFDCYGTLIDWETGIVEALRPWTSRHGIDDEALLSAFAAHETVVESEHPAMRYPGVLTDDLAARRRASSASTSPARSRRRSAPRCRTGRRSPTRPTRSPGCTQRFRLIILSNIDRTSFAASARRLGIEFDLVITAEDVGSYKPSPANFAALLDATAGAPSCCTSPSRCTTTTSRPRRRACRPCGSTAATTAPGPGRRRPPAQ